MSVLIKGLDMPETEYMDIRIYRDGTAVIAIGKKPYYREFETVEVPTSHGDLIDTERLKDSLLKWLKQDDPTHPSDIPPLNDIIVSTIMTVEEQPTVIEAEE